MASGKAKSTGGSLWETFKTVVIALLIATIFRTVFFQPFFIPSGSMKDTLLIGDFLFVNKMAYGYSWASCPSLRIQIQRISPDPIINIQPERICGIFRGDGRLFGGEPEVGDVVVFRHPVREEDFIKRVIGLPNDTIQVIDGVVYINGEAAPQVPTDPFIEIYEPQGAPRINAAGQVFIPFPRCTNDRDLDPDTDIGADCLKDRSIESLPNGHSHAILSSSPSGLNDDTIEFTVPEGHFFVMGDNRDNSVDSRVPQRNGGVGMVPIENLVGRADRVILSASGRRIV
ncbi:MAG: signal peptidase I, partial [Pseudomonadota bacterium]